MKGKDGKQHENNQRDNFLYGLELKKLNPSAGPK